MFCAGCEQTQLQNSKSRFVTAVLTGAMLGTGEGRDEGVLDGLSEGKVLGSPEGFVDGFRLGDIDGSCDG